MPEITVKVARLEGSIASQGSVREHSVNIDRPVGKSGDDRGPMGGEVLSLGLWGCFISNLIAGVNTRYLNIRGQKAVVHGALKGNPPRFTAATLAVHGSGVADDAFDKLITVAARGCIVANALTHALVLEVKSVAAA